ncbi:MAG: hypothetical protein EBV43_05180 [Actinobacteria bacterium]|nr:hypothetical protein [Actinomycetota bacterium]
MQGAEAMGNGIAAAGQSLGGGIAGAAAAWKKEAAQANSNAGVIEAYSKMNDKAIQDTGKPIIAPEFLASIASEKNKDKVSGGLMAVAPVFDSYLSTQRQIGYLGAQTNAAANLAAFKGTLPQPDKTRVLTTNTGLFRDNGSGTPEPILGPDGKQLQPNASQNIFDQLARIGNTQPADASSAPQQPAQQSSANPYRVGGIYGGKTYLGGDPNNPTSWK